MKTKTAVEWLEERLDILLELFPSQWEEVNKEIEQAKEMEKEESDDLLLNLINLNKKAISENWKMEDVGEEFFKVFAYSDKLSILECEHKNKTQNFSDVFGCYISCTTCGKTILNK